jgi:phage terminase large subunit-like protein
MTKRQSKPVIGPVEFIDRVIKRNEKNEPWTLTPYQRRVLEMALRRDPSGALLFRLVVLSEPKKSGKTFLAACLCLWWAIINKNTEVICVANDLEQATSRVFRTVTSLIEHNQPLQRECEVLSNLIRVSNGTRIWPISSDFKGAAGSRHSLAIFDELWGFSQESARRLYEELTPPPSEFSAWTLVVSYAGFLNESELLQSIYERGMSGRRVDTELECYENDELFLFWSHTPRQSWQDEAYYRQQRKILRPSQYLRLHENRWTSSENKFIEASVWDACVLPGLNRDTSGSLFVGVDASVRHDSTAVCCVRFDKHSDNLLLADHRIWQPSPNEPMDLEATVETYLRRLQNYNTIIEKVLVDPFQMHRSITTLEQAGMNIEGFAQTLPNLTLCAETLYSALTNQRLRVYNAPDLRQHIINSSSVETSRGFRLVKEKSSLKIDGAIALAMACVAALSGERPAEPGEFGVAPYRLENNLDGFYTPEEPAPYRGPTNALRADRY